jgi:hypothetical protein
MDNKKLDSLIDRLLDEGKMVILKHKENKEECQVEFCSNKIDYVINKSDRLCSKHYLATRRIQNYFVPG